MRRLLLEGRALGADLPALTEGGARWMNRRCEVREQRQRAAFGCYLLLLAAAGASRLSELRRSRANLRRTEPPIATAAPRSFPIMVAVHAALVVAPPIEVLAARRRPRPAVAAGALAVVAGATALRLWSIHTLGEQWNVRGAVPVEARVISSGPYRWIRHPNYVAVSLEMAALPLVWPAPYSAVALSAANLAVLSVRIRAEERLLQRLPAYAAAMGSKRRFIPGLI